MAFLGLTAPRSYSHLLFTALQAVTILGAMANEKNIWRLKF